MAEDLKHKTKVGIYWTFLNQGAKQILAFVVGIVMARLLSPSDYGITALPAVFISIALLFQEGGFNQALVRKPEVDNKDLSTAFFYSLGVGACCFIVLWLASPWIADFYNTPVLKWILRVSSINFLISPFTTPQWIIITRRLDFKTPTKITITNQIIGSIAGIIAAYYGYGVWSLVISSAVSITVGTFQICYTVRWFPSEKFDRESFKYLWDYGNKMIGANLIDTACRNITPMVLGKYYSTQDLGVYNRANGYAALPAGQITGLLTTVTFPILSKLQGDIDLLRRSYRRMIRLSCFVSFPVFMLLCALARPLVIIMITEKWESCIILLQIMCFANMWWPIQALNRNLMQVMGRSDLYLKVEVYKKAVLIAILCCSLPLGMIIFTSAQILQNMAGLYFNTYYSKKLINLGIWEQSKDFIPSFILSSVMFVGVLLSIYYIDNYWLKLVVGATVGVVIYLGGAILLKFDELNDIKYMLSR